MTILARYAHWHNSVMNVMRVTNYCLIRLEACSTSEALTWHNEKEEPVARQVRGPRGEAGTTTLLNGHSVKLTSNNL